MIYAYDSLSQNYTINPCFFYSPNHLRVNFIVITLCLFSSFPFASSSDITFFYVTLSTLNVEMNSSLSLPHHRNCYRKNSNIFLLLLHARHEAKSEHLNVQHFIEGRKLRKNEFLLFERIFFTTRFVSSKFSSTYA